MNGLRLREGGWVLIGAALLFAAILVWALAPAILRVSERPPGDGVSVDSYEFDLSNLRLPADAVLEPAMLHRDMVPTLLQPLGILTTSDIDAMATTRKKYVLPEDAVVGVSIGGESRAYPISMLNVHEMVHDELGGVPILVTWHWPSASPRVFDRRLNGQARTFGISGLMAGGNMVLYPKHPNRQVGGEPLFSQLLGRSISGKSMTLEPVPSYLTHWRTWRANHPLTTVAGRDDQLKKRYKHADPAAFYLSGGLISDSLPPDQGPTAKTPVLIQTDGTITIPGISPDDGSWFEVATAAGNPPRVELNTWSDEKTPRQALWHAVHALGAANP